MTDNEIREWLKNSKFHISKNNMILDNKQKPKVPNIIFQNLGILRKNKENLTTYADYVYGCIWNSLLAILMKNKHFVFQSDEIKNECKLRAVCAIDTIENGFDQNRGSTFYAYAYRICYTESIHVLEEMNKFNEQFILERDLETQYKNESDSSIMEFCIN